jgi:environmental stress-induced protein Ves
MKHFKASDFKTTNWSGGTTTELFIWPETAKYSDRNFDFRLSTATVEIETSIFTPLDGVARTLMVLEGEMKLIHEGQHEITLGPFDQDHFQGGWNTQSEGKCVDLNLMCRNNTQSTMTHFSMLKNSSRLLELGGTMSLIYCYRGSIQCDGVIGNTGDLFVIEQREALEIACLGDCEVVLIEVDG